MLTEHAKQLEEISARAQFTHLAPGFADIDKTAPQAIEAVLTKRRIPAPSGDKHTPQWKSAAIEAIEQDNARGLVRCLLMDNLTGHAWGVGRGQTENDAVRDALDRKNLANKPKTTAEIVAENITLKQELAKLRGETIEIPTDDAANSDPVTGETVTTTKTITANAGPSAYDLMSASELDQALKGREITVPGDKRTSDWKTAAVAALTADDADAD